MFIVLIAVLGSIYAADPLEYPPAISYSGGTRWGNFGSALAAAGDEFVITAMNNKPDNANKDTTGKNFGWLPGQGYLKVYYRDSKSGDFITEGKKNNHIFTYTVAQSANLAGNQKGALDGMGSGVAMTTSNIGVGCEKTNAALLFKRDGKGAWSGEVDMIQYFIAKDTDRPCNSGVYQNTCPSSNDAIKTGNNDHYGCAVALSGDTFVVAACAANAAKGLVYLYTRIANPNGDKTKFNTVPDLILNGNTKVKTFGWSLSITNSFLAIGAPQAPINGDAGEVFVYGRDGTTNLWSGTAITVTEAGASNPFVGKRSEGRFGYAISMTDKSIIVGDHAEIVDGQQTTFQGEVTIWNYDGSTDQSFVVKDRCTVKGTKDYQQFGQTVGVYGTRFAVGGNDNKVWVYGTSTVGDLYGDGSWSDDLIAMNSGEGGGFGLQVLVHDTYVVSSAPEQFGKTANTENAGAVYIYRIFEPSVLSITFYFGVGVFSLTMLCFAALYLRFRCAPAGDGAVIDAKLAAKAARLGYDHHNIAHKNVLLKKGEKDTGEKKYLAPQQMNSKLQVLKNARSPLAMQDNPLDEL